VGGDFYDFFLVDADHLGLVIGDVSGKGVPAAIFMAMTRTLLKSSALQGMSPGDCLRHVNTLLCLDNEAEMFVTIFYGILNTRTGQLDYSNGGHNLPYLLRTTGAVEQLPGTGGMALGISRAWRTRQADRPRSRRGVLPLHRRHHRGGARRRCVVLGRATGRGVAPSGRCGAGRADHRRGRGRETPCRRRPQSDDLTALCVRRRLPPP